MFIKILAIGLGVLACALAEAPLQQHRQRSGPYAPSGWRPRKPFNLPGEYLPPTSEFEAQQQQQQQRPQQFEVTKERVDFVGQSQGSAFAGTGNDPQESYLPPDGQDPEEFPRTQSLPVEGRYPVFNRDRTQFQARPQGGFNNQQRKPVRQGPNGQRDLPTAPRKPHQKYQPAEEPVEQPQGFQPQQAQFFQPQRQQPQKFQPPQQKFQPQQQSFQPQQQLFQPQQQTFQPQQQQPQPQLFQPQQQQSFQPQQQSVQPQQQQTFQPQQLQNQQFFPDQPRPAQQYGAPFTNDQYPEPRNSQDVKYEIQASEPEDIATENDEFDQQQQQKQTETDNDNNDEYRSDGPPAKATKGQYYIVGPDNSIQRVVFTTKEDLDENGRAAGNGAFTAQLKYSPAGAVKDPIYRYNNRGQLVRVVKK